MVLAHQLKTTHDIETALRQYEAKRAPRTAYITNLSRRIGILGQLQNPVACKLRNALLRAVPLRIHKRQLESIVRFDGELPSASEEVRS